MESARGETQTSRNGAQPVHTPNSHALKRHELWPRTGLRGDAVQRGCVDPRPGIAPQRTPCRRCSASSRRRAASSRRSAIGYSLSKSSRETEIVVMSAARNAGHPWVSDVCPSTSDAGQHLTPAPKELDCGVQGVFRAPAQCLEQRRGRCGRCGHEYLPRGPRQRWWLASWPRQPRNAPAPNAPAREALLAPRLPRRQWTPRERRRASRAERCGSDNRAKRLPRMLLPRGRSWNLAWYASSVRPVEPATFAAAERGRRRTDAAAACISIDLRHEEHALPPSLAGEVPCH